MGFLSNCHSEGDFLRTSNDGDSEALAHNSPCGNDLNRLSERDCVLIKCDLKTAKLFKMWVRFLTV